MDPLYPPDADLPPILSAPFRNHSQEQDPLQGVTKLRQAGDMLAQVSIQEQPTVGGKRINQKTEQEMVEQIQYAEQHRHVKFAQDTRFQVDNTDNTGEEEQSPEATPSYAQQVQDLNLIAVMQSLQIAVPEDPEIPYQGDLLMKVGCSSGTPRNLPLQPLNEAMATAWGKNYWVIDQVKHAMYKAYFRNEEAMDSVIRRNPNKDVDEYKFNTIYVPIRVFGVPERFRVQHMMRYVIEKIAQTSDIHSPPEISMKITSDFVEAYAKMDIRMPVKDKVKYFVGPNEYILLYINYGKIKRICTFCSVMFHTVDFYPNRRKLIHDLISIGAIGLWTSQVSKIPEIAFELNTNQS
ncbi:hypothetical protein BRADI_2g26355v3 [Brachypodium distachyon]|uniref:Uncharacterized protein n=1 Tax=Brachypodium distachyon TaxID=15368 RepID=A0A0Q3J191_BRADI|nr:hypothetical protein BRADI_2g26355v3 [Brachypodium distachyon]